MTFIAALFSMPFFQWRQATVGESAMAEQFWIYWAVSAPLTLLTVTAYAVMYRVQMHRQRKDKEAGIRSLRDALNGTGIRDLRVSLGNGLSPQKKDV